MRRPLLPTAGLVMAAAFLTADVVMAQPASVNPGINDSYKSPDPGEFAKRFETENREIYANREKIVAAAKAKSGMSVADVGAGTGLFTRLFANAVGPEGKVYAVDIAESFLKHIDKTSAEEGLKNVSTLLATADSSNLAERSIDLAFICDTYHHFEFPEKTMLSIHRALRPGGRVVVVDFHRIEGVSSDWVMSHVRAGQEVFRREIESAGFRLVEEPKFLEENYLMVFEKVDPPAKDPAAAGEPQGK